MLYFYSMFGYRNDVTYKYIVIITIYYSVREENRFFCASPRDTLSRCGTGLGGLDGRVLCGDMQNRCDLSVDRV